MSEVVLNAPQGQTESSQNNSQAKPRNNWKQLCLLFLGTSFFGNGTLGITKSFLSAYLKTLGFTVTQIGLISGLRGSKALIDLIAGYTGDKFGRKKIAYVGQFFLVISHIMYGCVSSLNGFMASASLHGVGSGFNAGAATFGTADLTKRSRAFGQGLLECANYASQTIFGIIGGFLVVWFSIKYTFIILGLMPIFGMFVVWKYLKEPRDISDAPPKKHINMHEVMPFLTKMISTPKMLAVYYAAFFN